jgi:predicted methyltransferase
MQFEIDMDRGCGSCGKDEGVSKKVFPIRLPEESYRTFRETCNNHNTSTAVIIAQMIKQFNEYGGKIR